MLIKLKDFLGAGLDVSVVAHGGLSLTANIWPAGNLTRTPKHKLKIPFYIGFG